MITYKVVDKNTRYGSNYACFVRGEYEKVELENILEKRPELKQYFPKYKKGSVIKSVPGSVGLMSFKNKEYAKEFRFIAWLDKKCSIIKCRAKGDITENNRIISFCGDDPERLLMCKETRGTPAPEGTVFSEELEVLE